MKFKKFTGLMIAGAALLSVGAIAPLTANAATVEGNAEINGGQALPQDAQTTAGISFGQTSPTGNTGYLRLQMVPKILDFGNHEQFFSEYPIFTADGKNVAKDDNNRYPNYKSGSTNLTAILNTDDAALANVQGKVWTTVVDKQTTRTADENAKDTTGKTDSAAGTWTLNVKADGPLSLVNDAGESTGKTIDDATLTLLNTAYGQTGDVYALTNETQDDGFTPSGALTAVSDLTNTISMNLTGSDTNHQVASAAAGEGEGANVFGWNKTNIKLVLPKTSVVENGIYETTLTWTLATGLN
ncbi:WxL domain-containing protein [Lacticaseibacillus yichunensis]|uniref:WxL domain-containing protein n=1 Tax=Lacticaseibacillus yichunensis TaxID=2486015 RepID=A0ABW4CR06_9LACO|nr:WxL domain-containing protein [Lacticaseibacillus yichunensis]